MIEKERESLENEVKTLKTLIADLDLNSFTNKNFEELSKVMDKPNDPERDKRPMRDRIICVTHLELAKIVKKSLEKIKQKYPQNVKEKKQGFVKVELEAEITEQVVPEEKQQAAKVEKSELKQSLDEIEKKSTKSKKAKRTEGNNEVNMLKDVQSQNQNQSVINNAQVQPGAEVQTKPQGVNDTIRSGLTTPTSNMKVGQKSPSFWENPMDLGWGHEFVKTSALGGSDGGLQSVGKQSIEKEQQNEGGKERQNDGDKEQGGKEQNENQQNGKKGHAVGEGGLLNIN